MRRESRTIRRSPLWPTTCRNRSSSRTPPSSQAQARRPDETKPAESQNGSQNAAEVSANGPEGLRRRRASVDVGAAASLPRQRRRVGHSNGSEPRADPRPTETSDALTRL
jgi:hypothetical protein